MRGITDSTGSTGTLAQVIIDLPSHAFSQPLSCFSPVARVVPSRLSPNELRRKDLKKGRDKKCVLKIELKTDRSQQNVAWGAYVFEGSSNLF